MPLSWESRFASLVRDFLNSDGALANGVPAAADLPKAIHDESAPAVRPSIIIGARITDTQGLHYRVLHVTVILFTQTGADGTDPALAGTWMQSIRQSLQEGQTWGTWLADLPAEQRQNWCLLKRPLLGEPETANDDSKHTRDFHQPLTLRVAVDF